MKISIQSQTVLERGQKKAKLIEHQKKANLYLWYCYSFVTEKHMNYKNIHRIFFQN